MTWKAIPPAEVCDIMAFWAAAEWPLSLKQVQDLAVERFGWTIEVDRGKSYLMNTVSGLSVPDVSTVESRGRLLSIGLRVTDLTKEVTAESTAFLGDAFTQMVREGESRWGRAQMREHKGVQTAAWATSSDGEIRIARLAKIITARFETPQGVEVERALNR